MPGSCRGEYHPRQQRFRRSSYPRPAEAGGKEEPGEPGDGDQLHARGRQLASRKPGGTGPVIWWNGHGMNTLVPASSQQGNSYIARQFYRRCPTPWLPDDPHAKAPVGKVFDG